MVTLLDFVHRQKLLEPANPDFSDDITNVRNMYNRLSFRLKGMERTGRDLITRVCIFYCVKRVPSTALEEERLELSSINPQSLTFDCNYMTHFLY